MDDHEQDSHLDCDHDDCASGKRNRYYGGKRMRTMSFEVEQKYLIERRRLLNRAMHGWGVVYGFDLHYVPATATDHAAIEIGEGLALDRAGRELFQPGKRMVTGNDVYMSDEDRQWLSTNATAGAADNGAQPEACWLLSVHYAERQQGPVRVKDDCSCDRAEWDYLCETVRYSVERVDTNRCHAGHPCELSCHCSGPDSASAAPQPEPTGRGAQQCMSAYLSQLDPNAEQSGLTKDGEQLRFDLKNGIPLARVGLRWNVCKAPEVTAILDDWGPRRLVKRNDLLFDLIRGCDLTRISEISWKTWHRRPERIAWDEFAKYFETDSGKKFTVTFSAPVQQATVTIDCFAMSVVVADASGWGELRRVPLDGVQLTETAAGDPAGSTRSATLVFDAEWLADELPKTKKHSLFSRGPSRVDIEVRTDFILDMCGQAVDGSPIGAQSAPTGNGSPGGCFLSTFRVLARPQQ